jgi:hypothetical protein
MPKRAITVVETDSFRRQAERIWSEEEIRRLIDHVALNPEVGDILQGTGGVRKMHWRASGRGRRGGARVVYFFPSPDCPIYLLLACAKAQADDLSPDERQVVSEFAAAIKALANKTQGGSE